MLTCSSLVLVFVCVQSVNANQMWKHVVVSNSSLQNTTLRTEQVKATSDIICSMIASRLPWAKLFYFLDGVCNIFNFLAVPYEIEHIADPVNCMTNIDGCLVGSLLFELGELFCLPIRDYTVYQCVAGQVIKPLPSPPREKCPAPFIMTAEYGCLLFNATATSWCEARKQCLTYGSDLVSFENYVTGSQFCKNFEISTGFDGHDIHIGFYGNKTSFQWVSGTVLNPTATTAAWHAAHPKGTTTPNCGACYGINSYATILFYEFICNTQNFAYVCQIQMIN